MQKAMGKYHNLFKSQVSILYPILPFDFILFLS